MSTKGKQLSIETRAKISFSKTKYELNDFIDAWERYATRLNEDPKLLPTIGGYCLEAGVRQSNILKYSALYPEVDEIINYIADMQQEYLLTKSITQQVNPVFSMFLLKSKHNYRDSPQQLTQNNYMNISPDVLKDALSLMSDKKQQ